jgi:hypothetical protein
VGHPGGDNFIVITTKAQAEKLRAHLKQRFAEEVLTHYNFIDRDHGYILVKDARSAEGGEIKAPLMRLAVGVVTPDTRQFSDIREITDLAAEARRQDAAAEAGNA